MRNKNTLSSFIAIAVFLSFGIGVYIFVQKSFPYSAGNNFVEQNHEETTIIANRKIGFDLLDPELAPDEIKEQVMLGYNIIINTKKFAGNYSGNDLSCNNCHFCGGNTLGGKNGGISLVGVTNIYPRYSTRSKKNITLKDRITNCFMRSMNGVAPASNSETMDAIIAYLSWISIEVMNLKNPPWLGLKELNNKHQPDLANGAKIYLDHCSACHQPTGAGTQGVPPLWGNGSYNDGAGMNTLPMLSSFAYYNMPYQQPVLSQDEAKDVAAFVIHQSRPLFKEDLQKQKGK